MSNALPYPSLELAKPHPDFTMPIRIVATAQAFAIRVTWEETLKQPIMLPVRVKLYAGAQLKPLLRITSNFAKNLGAASEALL